MNKIFLSFVMICSCSTMQSMETGVGVWNLYYGLNKEIVEQNRAYLARVHADNGINAVFLNYPTVTQRLLNRQNTMQSYRQQQEDSLITKFLDCFCCGQCNQ